MTTDRPTLVVGVGTDRGDDAAGLLVARRLRAAGVPVAVTELAGDLTDLLHRWQPGDRVAVVDAVRSGAPPGTVHVLDVTHTPLPVGMAGASTHVLGLADAVELARVLGRLPARLLVVGIEGAEWTDGVGLSPAVAAAVTDVVGRLQLLTGATGQPAPATAAPPDAPVSRCGGAARR